MPGKILVTGATGGTGVHAVEKLLQNGKSVVALAHNIDHRSEKLAKQGAEIICGDLSDLQFVKTLLRGIDSLYFCYPISEDFARAAANLIYVAPDAGVKYIVDMSQKPAREDATSHASQQHWVTERLFDRCGVPVTHIRPTFFADWFLRPIINQQIRNQETFRAPFGDGRHAPITAYDIGRFAASLLLNPTPHFGKSYDLFGPVELDHYQMAEKLTAKLGRSIKYEPMEIEEFDKYLEKKNIPNYFRQHIRSVAVDYQNGIFEGEDKVFKDVTGTGSMTFEDFIEENKSAFSAEAVLAK